MMSVKQPFLTTVEGTRRFACSAVAVQGIIIDTEERVLLLSSPTRNRPNEWQAVSGALEAGETILAGVLRETHEEVGAQVQVRPLGAVHAHTFHLDTNVPYVIGIHYLLAYEGGAVRPGDDMHGAHYRWWSLEELGNTTANLHSSTQLWILQRAVLLYRLLCDQPSVPLQSLLESA